MNKFHKFIFLIFLFSFVLSITFNSIEPNSVTLGEVVEFTLNVTDTDTNYDSDSEDFYVYLGDENDDGIYIDFKKQDNGLYKSDYTIIMFYEKESLKNNPKKNIYYHGYKTNLTVEIKKPSEIKLVYFEDYYTFYNYGISRLYFKVNYNELFNSNVKIQFGENMITNCTIDEDDTYSLNCYHEFSTQNDGDKLNLKFNGKETDYSITIHTPSEFSKIYDIDKYKYYISSTEQIFIFDVNSCYKIEEHKIVLVPLDSKNSNITLTSCKYYGKRIDYAQCSGILNTLGKYYVFYDNKNTSELISVFPEPTSIYEVEDIDPNSAQVLTETKFNLEVDYIINLDKAVFTLVDQYNKNNKIYLTKCSKVEGETYEITCIGTLKEAGYYNLYLNGINQGEEVYAYSESLKGIIFLWKCN